MTHFPLRTTMRHLFVCCKLKFLLSMSPTALLFPLFFMLLLGKQGVFAAWPRIKTDVMRKLGAFVELFCNSHDLKPSLHPIYDSNPGIIERKKPHFGAFSPLPYMAGQRYIVPVFNRLAAAALLLGFSFLTLVVLNYFWSKENRPLNCFSRLFCYKKK